MPRRIFHSFRFSHDWFRVQTVRQIGAIEGQRLMSSNDWEKVKQKGDKAVQTWIDSQLKGRSCVVVLIGAHTAGRKWVKYEMRKGWADGKGVVGIHIHALKDSNELQAPKGRNPLSEVRVETKNGTKALADVAKTYMPPYSTSKNAYNYIRDNIDAWVEEAIAIRKSN